MDNNIIKCSRCKVDLPEDNFEKNRSGKFYKQCNQCRKYRREYAQKNRCPHGKDKYQCKDCGGSQICEHNKQKPQCKECGGSQICEHGKNKSQCKDCRTDYCEHGKRKAICKDCGGSQICEHGRRRVLCKECKGSGICEHNKQKPRCRECKGGGICEHDRLRDTCKDCGGSRICEHNKQKYNCRECVGNGICEHDKLRNICRECKGGGICEHNKQRRQCPTCDPMGYTTKLVRDAVRRGINGSSKSKKSIEYLGCSILAFREHIEKQFVDDMSWENQGAWHIDHRIPIKYNNPTDEQIIERLHYTNCQPLWACDNLKKGNRYIG